MVESSKDDPTSFGIEKKKMRSDGYLTQCDHLFDGEYFIMACQCEGGHVFKVVNYREQSGWAFMAGNLAEIVVVNHGSY